jgi:hypothetical protein
MYSSLFPGGMLPGGMFGGASGAMPLSGMMPPGIGGSIPGLGGGAGLPGMSGGAGGLLPNMSLPLDANGQPITPEVHNRAIGSVGEGIGGLIGAWFGMPTAGMMAGKGVGDDIGNLIAGRNMYTGRGDLWSNLNPMDPNGPIGGPTGPYGPLAQVMGGFGGGNIGLAGKAGGAGLGLLSMAGSAF